MSVQLYSYGNLLFRFSVTCLLHNIFQNYFSQNCGRFGFNFIVLKEVYVAGAHLDPLLVLDFRLLSKFSTIVCNCNQTMANGLMRKGQLQCKPNCHTDGFIVIITETS